LWNYFIPQVSQGEDVLGRLTLSIAALHKASKLKALGCDGKEASAHQQYAFQTYGQALDKIRIMVSSNHDRNLVRTALIASLLIYCFENIHGESGAAIKHLESALRLLRNQFSNNIRRSQHLLRLPPTPALEDDLVAAFARLDNVLLSRFDSSVATTTQSAISRISILNINYMEDSYVVPNRFQNLDDARSFLEHFIFRVTRLHYHKLKVKTGDSHVIVHGSAGDLCAVLSL
jgi:hypothetical protein